MEYLVNKALACQIWDKTYIKLNWSYTCSCWLFRWNFFRIYHICCGWPAQQAWWPCQGLVQLWRDGACCLWCCFWGWKRRMQFRLQGQRQLTSWKLGFNSVNDSRRVSRAVVSPSFSCNHDRKQVLFMPAWLYTIQDFMLCRRQQYAVGFLCVDVRFLCIDVGSPCLSVSCTTCPCNPSHPMT